MLIFHLIFYGLAVNRLCIFFKYFVNGRGCGGRAVTLRYNSPKANITMRSII